MDLISRDDPKAKEYKEKLLGAAIIEEAPERYWELQLKVNLPGALAVWDDLPIHTRAEMRAYYYLNNMVDLLRQHEDNMKQARKQAVEKAKVKH